jgi:hypothetical protein
MIKRKIDNHIIKFNYKTNTQQNHKPGQLELLRQTRKLDH